MAAVLSNQGGYYRPGAYISECRRMNLTVEGPDINLSRWKYCGDGRKVVIGFMAIKGLSVTGVERILTERDKNGFYKNLDDFSRRVKLGRDDIIALSPAGVFDCIAGGLSRAMQARRLLSLSNGNVSKEQGGLFAAETAPDNLQNKTALAPSKKNVRNEDDLWEEYLSLGFLRQVHTLAIWKEQIIRLKRIKAGYIREYIGQNVKLLGWPITQKEVWTKDGLTMSFLSFEDETALYETVIFPEIYDRYNKLLFDQRPLLVYGKVTDDQGALIVEVRKIEALPNPS
jgi:DNA polymerase-3 subunit alpha/error-prone DNA polymerase